MNKRILLIFVIAVIFACLCVVSVNAMTVTEATELYESYFDAKAVETIDGVTVEEHVNPIVLKRAQNGGFDVTAARVELSCTCERGYHVYPTYYITKYYAENETISDTATFDGNKVFHLNYDDLNKKNPCGATYDKNTVVAIEIPHGYQIIDGGHETQGTATYNHGLRMSTSLKLVDMSTCDSLITLDVSSYHEVFGNTPNLEYVKLGKNITTIPGWSFEGCTSLKRVVITNDSKLKKIEGNAFYNCTSLEAFYLPDSIVTLNGSGKEDGGPFTRCTSIYFINDPDNLEKKDIYYFPQSLKQIDNEALKNCPSLNKVLVFGENVTAINTNWTFATNNKSERQRTSENPLTVVFKGNITKFCYASSENKYITYIFAGKEQGSFNSTHATNNTDSTCNFYICAQETHSVIGANGNTSFTKDGFLHNAEKTGLRAMADCVNNERVFDLCFCGKEMNVSQIENSALGHSADESTKVAVYENYLAKGEMTYYCTACQTNVQDEASPLIESFGYSFATFIENGAGSMSQGFCINREMLQYVNADIDYGIVAAANLGADLLDPATYDNALIMSLTEENCEYFDIKVCNLTGEKADCLIVFCAYLKVGDDMIYIDNGVASSTVLGISYNQLTK